MLYTALAAAPLAFAFALAQARGILHGLGGDLGVACVQRAQRMPFAVAIALGVTWAMIARYAPALGLM